MRTTRWVTLAAQVLICAGSQGPNVFPQSRVARVKITIIPRLPNRYIIDATPALPLIQAKATLSGSDSSSTLAPRFVWRVSLRVNRHDGTGDACSTGCGLGDEVSFDDSIVQDDTTSGDEVFTVQFKDPGKFLGGRLRLTATTTVNGRLVTGETSYGLRIDGANPQRADIQKAIAAEVADAGIPALSPSEPTDVLKRIACHESCNDQKQFDARPDGGIGSSLISCDNGVGIFQITAPLGCSDSFTKECRGGIFNWRENVRIGVQVYKNKVALAEAYPQALSGKRQYLRQIARINAVRRAANKKPIANLLPPFTTRGEIGSKPPNQLLEDAVRGYNGFMGLRYGTHLHEFAPDLDFLLDASDSDLVTPDVAQRVWVRVYADRPDYVSKVRGRSATCSEDKSKGRGAYKGRND